MPGRLLGPLVCAVGCVGGRSADLSSGPSESTDDISEFSGTDSSESDSGSATTATTGEGESDESPDSDSTDTAVEGFEFGPPHTSNVFAFTDLELGDLDADGCADLVLAATGAPPRLNIYPGGCDGTFPLPPVTHVLTSYDDFVLGDLDADGRPDVITKGSGAPPRLEARLTLPNFDLGVQVASDVWNFDLLWSGDVDGQPGAEVLTFELDGLPPTVFIWSATGASLAAMASSELAAFEFGGFGLVDGDPGGDLLTASQGLGGQVTRWSGQPDGSLDQTGRVQPIANLGRLSLGDLDGDGRVELLTDVPGNDWVVQLYANLGTDFGDPQLFAAVGYVALRTADLDGDQQADLIVAPAGDPPRITSWISQ